MANHGALPLPEFFVARWHCRIPIARLFWWDMLLVGTSSRRRTPFAPLFQLTSLIWLVTFTLT
ncbi:MAG: hypothetical protein ABIF28_08790 [Pseudomonadota bacterium]